MSIHLIKKTHEVVHNATAQFLNLAMAKLINYLYQLSFKILAKIFIRKILCFKVKKRH